MNETPPAIIWANNQLGLIIYKLSDSAYRLTATDIHVGDFTSFELACAYAHAEFILE
jgi:hypothetical protein